MPSQECLLLGLQGLTIFTLSMTGLYEECWPGTLPSCTYLCIGQG